MYFTCYTSVVFHHIFHYLFLCNSCLINVKKRGEVPQYSLWNNWNAVKWQFLSAARNSHQLECNLRFCIYWYCNTIIVEFGVVCSSHPRLPSISKIPRPSWSGGGLTWLSFPVGILSPKSHGSITRCLLQSSIVPISFKVFGFLWCVNNKGLQVAHCLTASIRPVA